MLKSFAETNIGNLSFGDIEKKVCEIFTDNSICKYNVTPENLKRRSRIVYITHARFTCMYIARKYAEGILLKELNDHYNSLDHTTVMNGIRRIEEILDGDMPRKDFKDNKALIKSINESIKFVEQNK